MFSFILTIGHTKVKESSFLIGGRRIISASWNENCLIQDLNTCRRVHFYVCNHYVKSAFKQTGSLSEFDIGITVRVFANETGDLGSIPGRVVPKTQKMVLDASLLNTQHYKVRITGKVEQFRERCSALPFTLV